MVLPSQISAKNEWRAYECRCGNRDGFRIHSRLGEGPAPTEVGLYMKVICPKCGRYSMISMTTKEDVGNQVIDEVIGDGRS